MRARYSNIMTELLFYGVHCFAVCTYDDDVMSTGMALVCESYVQQCIGDGCLCLVCGCLWQRDVLVSDCKVFLLLSRACLV